MGDNVTLLTLGAIVQPGAELVQRDYTDVAALPDRAPASGGPPGSVQR